MRTLFRFSLTITMFLLTTKLAYALNSFLVAPSRVEFDVDRPKVNSFIVSNNGTEKIRIRVKPVYFTPNSRELNTGEYLDSDFIGKDSLVPFMRVSPKAFSLKPGQQRTLRVSIRPPKDLPVGEYRAHLLVSMLEIAQKMQSAPVEGKVTMNLNFKMQTAVAIYGRKSNGIPSVELLGCRISDTNKLMVELSNTSPWRFDGWLNSNKNHRKKLFLFRESKHELDLGPTKKLKGKVNFTWRKVDDEKILGQSSCVLNSKKTPLALKKKKTKPNSEHTPLVFQSTKKEVPQKTVASEAPKQVPTQGVNPPEKKKPSSFFSRLFGWFTRN